MILNGARIALGPLDTARVNICVRRGKVFHIKNRKAGKACQTGPSLDLEGFLVLPGLINAHDHLEFNLFPRLGRGTYPNARAWARDIYHPDNFPIRQQLDIPKSIRLFWGGVKNLLAGFTSVAHHNPYDASIFESNFPVRVIKRFGWAHSVDFCSDLREQFRRTPAGTPFIIHAAEGTDDSAHSDLRALDDAGVLGPNTVLVHGVAISPRDLPLLKQRGVSLIWCPTSNLFTLGRTLDHAVLESSVPVALGTDSALTADGDLVDEVRVASRYTSIRRLYNMLTQLAARILRLNQGEGSIRDNGVADLIVIRDSGRSPAESLATLRPELILVGGQVKLVSVELARRFELAHLCRMHKIEIERRGEWFIDADIPSLAAPAKWVLNNDFRLAGKRLRC